MADFNENKRKSRNTLKEILKQLKPLIKRREKVEEEMFPLENTLKMQFNKKEELNEKDLKKYAELEKEKFSIIQEETEIREPHLKEIITQKNRTEYIGNITEYKDFGKYDVIMAHNVNKDELTTYLNDIASAIGNSKPNLGHKQISEEQVVRKNSLSKMGNSSDTLVAEMKQLAEAQKKENRKSALVTLGASSGQLMADLRGAAADNAKRKKAAKTLLALIEESIAKDAKKEKATPAEKTSKMNTLRGFKKKSNLKSSLEGLPTNVLAGHVTKDELKPVKLKKSTKKENKYDTIRRFKDNLKAIQESFAESTADKENNKKEGNKKKSALKKINEMGTNPLMNSKKARNKSSTTKIGALNTPRPSSATVASRNNNKGRGGRTM